MKIEKRGNSYRVRKTLQGVTYTYSFDHKPTKREIETAILSQKRINKRALTFKEAAEKTIDLKRNVISPASIRKYGKQLEQISGDFCKIPIDSITQQDVEMEIKRIAEDRAPKTVKDYYSFINLVIGSYRHDLRLRVTLPQRIKKEPYIPTREDVKAILDNVKGTRYEVPFLLGCYGMRVAEICALTPNDVNGNIIRIDKDLVFDENNQWVTKPPKTENSTRTIIVSDDVAEVIRTQGLYSGFPNSLNRKLHQVQEELGIEQFSFHKLRHYFASHALAAGLPMKTVQDWGGWKTSDTVRLVYEHNVKKEKEVAEILANNLFI